MSSPGTSIPVDVRSARLVKMVNAVVLHDDPTPRVAKRMRALARAARLFVEAHHLSHAKAAASDLHVYVKEAADQGEVSYDNAEAVAKVIESFKGVA